ncbi:MAG: hypothetical protein E3J52_11385 [Promethearchaeota archaeon]|nr:MAG: hypothetical protein E3J52_11385 [Candidatus Lokiarchaeota archaeon]
MAAINQIENTENMDINIRAENLIKDTKILNIARLAKMLVDLYGQDEPFKKVGKFEGKEIELYLKELDGYITFIITSDRNNFNCIAEKAKAPVARIIINVKEEKIIPVISSIIRSKSNVFGLAKLLKYIIPRKVKIKGSYVAAIKLVKCLMIGKHELYKKSK